MKTKVWCDKFSKVMPVTTYNPVLPPTPPVLVPPVVPNPVPMGTLEVVPKMVRAEILDAANIMDKTIVPMGGFCSSWLNPGFKPAIPPGPPPPPATPPAIGTPPVPAVYPPCTPTVSTAWAAGATTVLIANMPALNVTSSCVCDVVKGVIKVFPGPKVSHAGMVTIPP